MPDPSTRCISERRDGWEAPTSPSSHTTFVKRRSLEHSAWMFEAREPQTHSPLDRCSRLELVAPNENLHDVAPAVVTDLEPEPLGIERGLRTTSTPVPASTLLRTGDSTPRPFTHASKGSMG